MSVEERDKYSGYLTTGHDWNGIKELNTKVPKLLLVCLALAFIFALGYWYLLPAWPLGSTYTKGKLLLDQKDEVKALLRKADDDKLDWSAPMLDSTFDSILADQKLMSIVKQSGPALFADNCAMCHGQQGQGNHYFPSLVDSSWLWGGTPEAIHKTLEVGINAGVEGTRTTLMPAFGSTGVLDSQAIDDLVVYLGSLSSDQIGDGSRAEEVIALKRGAAVYKTNCTGCHGVDGTGNIALGAPNLTDEFWLYGGDKSSLVRTIAGGRAGLMPAWKGRLDDVELKLLSVYVATGLSTTNVENLDGKAAEK